MPIKELDDQGILYEEHSSYKVCSVYLPFTEHHWVELIDKDGDFLPACCSSISRVRDHLIEALRNGRYIDCDPMKECYELLINHDHWTSLADAEWDPKMLKVLVNAWNGPDQTLGEDPLVVLVGIWKKVAPFAYIPPRPGFCYDPNDPHGAMRLVIDQCHERSWDRLDALGGQDSLFFDCGMADRLQSLAVLTIAAKTLGENIKALDNIEPMEGWALMDVNDGKVVSLGRGIFFQKTREKFDKLLKELEGVPGIAGSKVTKVRISVDKGLEVLE